MDDEAAQPSYDVLDVHHHVGDAFTALGGSLTVAVNTNWDVFFDTGTKTWYLLNNGGWLAAPDAQGPWMPAGRLPAAFAALPGDANFAAVKKQIPGRTFTAQNAPTVFVYSDGATSVDV